MGVGNSDVHVLSKFRTLVGDPFRLASAALGQDLVRLDVELPTLEKSEAGSRRSLPECHECRA